MSCYHPILAVRSHELNSNGVRKVVPVGRLDKLTEDDIKKCKDSLLIPCGKCIGCRLDYSRYWADRMMLELETAKKGVFLTLTYDNDNITWTQFDENDNPLFGTLVKEDCQLFMKRLRKYFSDIRIRFYLAGEYGPSTLRPHYHCILFGISLNDIGDCIPFGRNELDQQYYISECIRRIWKKGNVLLSDVSWNTCAYVARYVTKKLSGDMEEQYARRNVIKEFSVMSRKPGIGAEYLELHPDCLDYQNINISTPQGGLKISIPKYYLQKVKLTDKERYDKIVSDRKRFADDGLLIELQSTTRGMDEYYAGKEVKKYADIRALKRNKVR